MKARIIFVAFIAFFFARNILMPLAYDDYTYAFVWDNNLTRERVESFGDIFKSQWSHWLTWNGRTVAHSLAQFFIWIGKPYFDVANTIVLALLVLLILKIANEKISVLSVTWIFFSFLFLTGENLVTTLWLTGTCNYLWMCLLQLIFVFPYVEAIRRGFKCKVSLIIPLGILAGWSNESGALATLFLTAILLGILKRKNLLERWQITGFLALIFGSAINILAPGNFVQLQFVQAMDSQNNYTPELFVNHFFRGFLPVLILDLVVLLPLIYYFFTRIHASIPHRFNTREILMLSFVAAGLIVPLSMIFAPRFDLRVSIISINFMLVASSFAFSQIKIKLPSLVTRTAATVLILYSATLIYSDVSLNSAVQENLMYIQQHKNEALVLKPLQVSRIFEPIQSGRTALNYLKYFGGINENKNFYVNIRLSKYYELKNIVGDKF